MRSFGSYHGIIIEEGLGDRSVLAGMRILGSKRAGTWTLLKVDVDEARIEELIGLVQKNLRIEKGVPFYAHFYRRGELIVVFPEKIFHLKPDKVTWKSAVNYGKSKGIPEEELDFKPCKFEEETY